MNNQTENVMVKCEACEKFFDKSVCSAQTHGECDCPKCQGYCECEEKKIPSLADYPEPALNDMIGGVAKAIRAITEGVPPQEVVAWVESRDKAIKEARGGAL